MSVADPHARTATQTRDDGDGGSCLRGERERAASDDVTRLTSRYPVPSCSACKCCCLSPASRQPASPLTLLISESRGDRRGSEGTTERVPLSPSAVHMSLFELTSLEGEYKLFDDDPFLLEPDDSCLADDASDETDSLTGTLSPPYLSHSNIHFLQHSHQPAAKPVVAPASRAVKPRRLLPPPPPAVTAAAAAELVTQEPDILTQDVYLQVHDYCIGSTASSPGLGNESNSIGADVASEGSAPFDVDEEEEEEDDRHMIDCDEEEEEDEEGGKSRKSSSSTSSPTASLAHRRKSMLDKSLSEEEKRLLQKEGFV